MHTVTGMSQYDTSDTHLRNPVNTVDNPESPPARALVPNTGIPVLQSTITGRSRQIIPARLAISLYFTRGKYAWCTTSLITADQESIDQEY